LLASASSSLTWCSYALQDVQSEQLLNSCWVAASTCAARAEG
jgi:hypothetical protein